MLARPVPTDLACRRRSARPVAGLAGLLAVAALLAWPPAARAGVYPVLACVSGADNGSFAGAGDSGVFADSTSCTNGALGPSALPDRTFWETSSRQLTFTSPPGTAIADFSLVRRLYYYAPVRGDGGQQLYVVMKLGGTEFEGSGAYENTVRNHLVGMGRWYGWPSNAHDTGTQRVSKGNFQALNGIDGARTLTAQVGCYVYGYCSLRSDGTVFAAIVSAVIVVRDDWGPTVANVEQTGLLASGERDGGEPVTFSADDNAGIKRVELLDVSDPAHPATVASEDYAGGGRTQSGGACAFDRAKPCPDLAGERIAPAAPLGPGPHTLVVRVVDSGDNVRDSAPQAVVVRGRSGGPGAGGVAGAAAGGSGATGRGAPNGRPASDNARLRAEVGRRGLRTIRVRYGRPVTVTGRLTDAGGNPIADAVLEVSSRTRLANAAVENAGTVRTASDGTYRYTAPVGPSRTVHVAYRSHQGDQSLAADDEVRLLVSSAARLRVRPRAVRNGRRVRFSGTLLGEPFPRAGVLVDLQVRVGRRWRTFTVTRARGRRIATRYRFTRTVGGRRYAFRARIRKQQGYPYELGRSNRVSVRVGG